jgi:hypothetical protein
MGKVFGIVVRMVKWWYMRLGHEWGVVETAFTVIENEGIGGW